MTLSERTLLARELHDGIAQDLVGVGYALDLILGNPILQKDVRIELRKVRFELAELTEKVRREIHVLHRNDGKEFLSQIQHYVAGNFSHLKITIHSSAVERDMESDKCYQVLRILNELLQNISQHSPSANVTISISQQVKTFTFQISDDGNGGAQVKENHFGIVGAQQRAEILGGSLNFLSNADGTIATLIFPIQ